MGNVTHQVDVMVGNVADRRFIHKLRNVAEFVYVSDDLLSTLAEQVYDTSSFYFSEKL